MNFVCAELPRPEAASDAVNALIDESFDPRTVQVLARRDGRVERRPLRRRYPARAGAVAGALVSPTPGPTALPEQDAA